MDFEISRRAMLHRATLGFGSLALADALSRSAHADSNPALPARSSVASQMSNPLAARTPQLPPRAKRCIYIFLDGGMSHLDTYDYKPLLARDDGKPLPLSVARPKFTFAPTGALLKSPFKFSQVGSNGMWASDLFPRLNSMVDDLTFIHSLHHDNEDHITAKNMIFTGSGREARPPLGSWLTYGLGSANENLPAFIEIMPGAPKSSSSAFLPAQFGGTAIGRPDFKTRDRAWDNLRSAASPQRRELDLIQRMNRAHQLQSPGDRALEAEIQNMELAFRMQTQAPELLGLDGESEATRRLYGIGEELTDDFGRACLMARRFAERGVRYITLLHSTRAFGNLWDQHKDLYDGHRNNAASVDLPIAGLLRDLRQRGMLDDTLVMLGSEFGRTPVFEFQDGSEGRHRNGRDHNPHGFTMWFAGAGLKAGYRHGSTDDYGYHAQQDKVTIHDLHATILHIMGLNHEALTFRHGGRDYRLTDVYGNVVRPILG